MYGLDQPKRHELEKQKLEFAFKRNEQEEALDPDKRRLVADRRQDDDGSIEFREFMHMHSEHPDSDALGMDMGASAVTLPSMSAYHCLLDGGNHHIPRILQIMCCGSVKSSCALAAYP